MADSFDRSDGGSADASETCPPDGDGVISPALIEELEAAESVADVELEKDLDAILLGDDFGCKNWRGFLRKLRGVRPRF